MQGKEDINVVGKNKKKCHGSMRKSQFFLGESLKCFGDIDLFFLLH